LQPNISADFRAHLGQAAVSAAKVNPFYLKMLNCTFSATFNSFSSSVQALGIIGSLVYAMMY